MATKLTAERVGEIIKDCFFREGEDSSNPVMAEGIMRTCGFHSSRLEKHKDEIGDLLRELPAEFHRGTGDGMSFLNACMTKDGDQWGEHPDVEALLILGIATKQAIILLPRAMWKALPGGMPYFVVTV